jgi:uncharacterized protein YjiS (DUF1127 family)
MLILAIDHFLSLSQLWQNWTNIGMFPVKYVSLILFFSLSTSVKTLFFLQRKHARTDAKPRRQERSVVDFLETFLKNNRSCRDLPRISRKTLRDLRRKGAICRRCRHIPNIFSRSESDQWPRGTHRVTFYEDDLLPFLQRSFRPLLILTFFLGSFIKKFDGRLSPGYEEINS